MQFRLIMSAFCNDEKAEKHGRVDEDNKQMEVSLYTEHSVRHSVTMRYVEPRGAVRTESGTIQRVKLT